MQRTARLMIAAFVLLGAMTVGAFAASSPGGRPPRAVDLPKIVTALTIPTSATATPRPSPASGAKPHAATAGSPSTHSSSVSKKVTSHTPVASPGVLKNTQGKVPKRNDHFQGAHGDDHEVVTPSLHESNGHGGGEQGHNSGD